MDHDTLIPQDWGPDEALRFCDFLDTLHSAIWRTHGRAMNLHLDGIAAREQAQADHDDDSALF